jgi:hypothetical protein
VVVGTLVILGALLVGVPNPLGKKLSGHLREAIIKIHGSRGDHGASQGHAAPQDHPVTPRG